MPPASSRVGLRHLPDPTIRHVACLRALRGLGDFLCAMPALAALRAGLPEARISLIGLPSNQVLVERYRDRIDALIAFPGLPGIPEKPIPDDDAAAFPQRMARQSFDLALQMQGDGTVINAFMPQLHASRMVGFAVAGAETPAPGLWLPYPDTGSEAARLLHLTTALGMPGVTEIPDFPISTAELSAWDAMRNALELRPAGYACMHPGSNEAWRRWPAGHFAVIGDRLAELGFRIVLTGTEAERDVAAEVAQRMRHACIDLAGRTPLGMTALLLRDAAVLVTNDTGVSHLAAAMRTPSAVLFLNAEARRWAPADQGLHRAILSIDRADQAGPGMRVSAFTIPSVDEVWAETQDLLGNRYRDLPFNPQPKG